MMKMVQTCGNSKRRSIVIAVEATFVVVVVCLFTFYNYIVPMGFLPCEIRIAFPGKSQLRQSGATQPAVHVGCFFVSIIHLTLTWTTGSVTCAQMLMHATAHRGVRTHVRE